MTDCKLKETPGGWWCTKCDPDKKRLLTGNYHRNCRVQRSRGLGDTIAKVTKFFGVKPCGGCKDRQKKLNELMPYREKQ